MSFKDDPVQQSGFAPRTLWLDRDGSERAEESFWRAWHAMNPTGVGNLDDRHIWHVAWAATIAAFSFVMEGRLGPER